MARRVHLPEGVKVADLYQTLQQFLGGASGTTKPS